MGKALRSRKLPDRKKDQDEEQHKPVKSRKEKRRNDKALDPPIKKKKKSQKKGELEKERNRIWMKGYRERKIEMDPNFRIKQALHNKVSQM